MRRGSGKAKSGGDAGRGPEGPKKETPPAPGPRRPSVDIAHILPHDEARGTYADLASKTGFRVEDFVAVAMLTLELDATGNEDVDREWARYLDSNGVEGAPSFRCGDGGVVFAGVDIGITTIGVNLRNRALDVLFLDRDEGTPDLRAQGDLDEYRRKKARVTAAAIALADAMDQLTAAKASGAQPGAAEAERVVAECAKKWGASEGFAFRLVAQEPGLSAEEAHKQMKKKPWLRAKDFKGDGGVS